MTAGAHVPPRIRMLSGAVALFNMPVRTQARAPRNLMHAPTARIGSPCA
jgi:hypothetical protein